MGAEADYSSLVAALCEVILKQHPQSSPESIQLFVERFLEGEKIEDLKEKIYFSLAHHLSRFWGLLQNRTLGKPNIEVYTYQITRDNVVFNRTIVHVVQKDMPFLVDSLLAVFQKFDRKIQYFMEQDFLVHRDETGQLREIKVPEKGYAPQNEGYMRFELRGHTSEEDIALYTALIEDVLQDVEVSVQDWSAMRQEVTEAIKEKTFLPNSPDAQEVSEFLAWLDDHHFTFLGYREFTHFTQDLGQNTLGLFRRDKWLNLIDAEKMAAHHTAFMQSDELISFNQTRELATVHRPIPMDVVEVKKIDATGKVIGIRQFLGLSASVSYNRSPRDIPILRHKVKRILTRSGHHPHGYAGRLVIQILEHFPRDELFLSSEEELYNIVMTVLHLGGQQKVALFTRRDPFGRFISCLVYVAKDRFSANLREVFGSILANAFHAEISSALTHVSDFAFARLHFMLGVDTVGDVDLRSLEKELEKASLPWTDMLQNYLVEQLGEDLGLSLGYKYDSAFPAGYQEKFSVQQALQDIQIMEELQDKPLSSLVYMAPSDKGVEELKIKFFRPEGPIPLSLILPILENLGFNAIKDMPFQIAPKGGEQEVWVQDFESVNMKVADLQDAQQRFGEAFAQIWDGRVENDGFNRLLLATNLTIRQISILRAYCKFLKQLGFNLSQHLIEETLTSYANISIALVGLFEARFHPDVGASREECVQQLQATIETAFDNVETLDQDRILRKFLNLILSTIRTNAFQKTKAGTYKPYISFKIDSSAIEEMPQPRPKFEIFVYSPRMEAIHLRGGKVARGGIRWSDRREDFRTEVLGLLKAQMIKNSVIVPVGSKGGFIVKNLPPDRESQKKEVVDCYKMMISGMLDLTDNIVDGKPTFPQDVVHYDESDPYLVVAADKGTATFSDIANSLAEDYGFWLGDAFASGGSSGYDHKKMGITARGAWESVRRHFRELDLNPDHSPFTVIGIGDMSGDIFGNGMLLSRSIKLVGAFNHQHIFIDPMPDMEKSFRERTRLFALPTSTWLDYDLSTISKGGGIFQRSDKWIQLTPEIQKTFGIPESVERLSPSDLIRYILKTPVDLIWFGGIGTFLKASHESHADVGDRANDPIRIDADEVRARVIVEGANLGMTQAARIAFALKGGKVNTDALDNSGGVDCSDHEVNIKILLRMVMGKTSLTLEQRNVLLAEMTDAVAALVLRDNYLQNQLLSLKQSQDISALESHALLIKRLEDEGVLDRQQCNLPNEGMLAERMANQQGLTRPELAVLVAYTKIWVYGQTHQAAFINDPVLEEDLEAYFPEVLQKKYARHIHQHPLRREITATFLANEIVNRFGGTIIMRLEAATGGSVEKIVKALRMVLDLYNLRSIWQEIESLDMAMRAPEQIALFLRINKAIEKATLWVLQNRVVDISFKEARERFGDSLRVLQEQFISIQDTHGNDVLDVQIRDLAAHGVPQALAKRIAALLILGESGLDIAETARRCNQTVMDTARVHFFLNEALGLRWAREALDQLPLLNSWQKLSRSLMYADLIHNQSLLVQLIFEDTASRSTSVLEKWLQKHAAAIERLKALVHDIQVVPDLSLAHFDILNRAFEDLTRQQKQRKEKSS